MPKVSVCCLTYNHERFLRQAIESVLMQETDFEVEMVIGEDCSTDGTRAIVEEYQRRYPKQIKGLLPTKNLGVMPNLVETLKACTGEYIALLDGDDYWTDPQKLALQVQILDSRPDIALCIHDAESFSDDASYRGQLYSQEFPDVLSADRPVMYQQEVVEKGWGIPTASMLFRSSALQIPDWFVGVYSGDYTMQLLVTQHGNIYYLPRVMSRYRVHAGGISQIANRTKSVAFISKRIFELTHFQKLLPKYAERYDGYLQYWYFERSLALRQNKEAAKGWLDYVRAITISPQLFRKWLFRTPAK
ncbi:Glycosyltransferase involved in cell wall bisynthesis [Hymenobacter daecheongensis DSM 21074]|uniref:Glycosyltransferase involved in cell wall bisynthesis n=1 Tax=Hymenobacter daecheongensis DSM 21074 TaxID=1121955 RepID=A0A1M6GG42_9BACT|nr:glycosyltransferase [Hymenobacter daecheongensis]SHJ08902.1 Glycosyltransferase involved in cell wall bisynthesis [Hymenobacter daecheongensis DSM 21074]